MVPASTALWRPGAQTIRFTALDAFGNVVNCSSTAGSIAFSFRLSNASRVVGSAPLEAAGFVGCDPSVGLYTVSVELAAAGAYNLAIGMGSQRVEIYAGALAVGWGAVAASLVTVGAPGADPPMDHGTVAIGARLVAPLFTRDAHGNAVPCHISPAINDTDHGSALMGPPVSATSAHVVLWRPGDMPLSVVGSVVNFAASDKVAGTSSALPVQMRCHRCAPAAASAGSFDLALDPTSAVPMAVAFCLDVATAVKALVAVNHTTHEWEDVSHALAGFAVAELQSLPNRTGTASLGMRVAGADVAPSDGPVRVDVMSCPCKHAVWGEEKLAVRVSSPLLGTVILYRAGTVLGASNCTLLGLPAEVLVGDLVASLLVAADPFGHLANCSAASAARFVASLEAVVPQSHELPPALWNRTAIIVCGNANNPDASLTALVCGPHAPSPVGKAEPQCCSSNRNGA